VLAGGDRDAPPGQVLDLGVQARLVLLHDQDVVRLLFRDKELGVLALGVQRAGGDDAPGQVQRLEQRREPGDLVGLTVRPDLAEHNTTALIEGGQQVYRLAAGAGMTGAPHRLAVHRDRPPGAPRVSCGLAGGLQPRIQPGPGGGIQRVRVCGFQHAADGGLIRRHEPPGQRITADAQSGQDLRRRVRDPFADRGERCRPGQHRRHGRH
jgi:hypothetical protein